MFCTITARFFYEKLLLRDPDNNNLFAGFFQYPIEEAGCSIHFAATNFNIKIKPQLSLRPLLISLPKSFFQKVYRT